MSRPHRSLLPVVLFVLCASAAMQGWQGLRDERFADQIAARAVAGDIRIIASDDCVYCSIASHWLAVHHVPFSECSIERNPGCAETYREAHQPGTPIVVVRGQQQLGFDPERVLKALG